MIIFTLVLLNLTGILSSTLLNTEYDYVTGKCEGYGFCINKNSGPMLLGCSIFDLIAILFDLIGIFPSIAIAINILIFFLFRLGNIIYDMIISVKEAYDIENAVLTKRKS